MTISKKELEEKIRAKIVLKWYNKSTKYILHVGPTNSGKTYNAVQALKKANSGIYLAPLRLLAWEIYDKLNKENVPCSLITGEERQIIKNSQITSCTIEIANYNKHHDVAVIDECFMIADRDRGKHWLRAIMEVRADVVHIISNPESQELICSLLKETNNKYVVNKYERKTPLEIKEMKVDFKKLPPKTILVVFSRINVLYYKYVLQQNGMSCSILYGNLPPEVKKEQIRSFVDGETDILVSTDVIGMGINLPCNNIIFLEKKKFDGEELRPLLEKEIKQISGRAGRFGISEKGTVSALDTDFIFDIETAFKSNIPEAHGFYGLDGEIYAMIPKEKPREKLKYFETLQVLPPVLKKYLKLEDLEKYYDLAKYYDLNALQDEIAWAFLTCPVNNNNLNYWKDCVSSAVHKSKIYFTESYSLYEINSIEKLSEAEISIANIDLYSYMNNNKILRNFIPPSNQELLIKLLEHKQIIIDNINTYLLSKKIKAKEVKANIKR